MIDMVEKAQPPIHSGCCIYKVPFDLRKLNEDGYTPKLVSIGPFHHNLPRLQNMQRYKLSYCKAFLQRTQASSQKLIQYIEDLEPNFRGCYSHTLDFSWEELVKIIFVDSCFIFELFWKAEPESGDRKSPEDKAFIFNRSVTVTIALDMLLLENQLPFFVLEHLYYMCFHTTSVDLSFVELTFRYFHNYHEVPLDKIRDFVGENKISHFTDLLRTFYLPHPSKERPSRDKEFVKHLPSATDLLEGGVKFKVNTDKCLLDLTFSGKVLEMPQCVVDDQTELVFRNVMALEQFHYPEEPHITDYVLVMDFLINTSKDVDTLIRKGVTVNYLGDIDSVANLFNGVWKNIVHVNFSSHYFELCKNLNDFHRNPCNKLKSTLRRDYCKSPWQTAASIAAIILLLFSFIQTVCSILQAVHS